LTMDRGPLSTPIARYSTSSISSIAIFCTRFRSGRCHAW
jgi:hypothetical protein